MSAITVVRLDTEEQVAAHTLIGECCKAIVHALRQLLRNRKARVSVKANGRPLHEGHFFQAIAIGGLYRRLLEQYPPDIQAEIEEHARTLAGLMARPEEVTP